MSTTLRYPSDLTDEQWSLLRPYWARLRTQVGHRITVRRRAIVNAIFYILRTGCQWRMLPRDFPPWGTVASQYSPGAKRASGRKSKRFCMLASAKTKDASPARVVRPTRA